jgi:hypothetical protein
MLICWVKVISILSIQVRLTRIPLALCRYRHKEDKKARYGQKGSLIHQFRLELTFLRSPLEAFDNWLVSDYDWIM